MLLYLNRIPENEQNPFIDKLNKVAKFLDVPAIWLMQLFHQESSVNSAAVNSITGATGLIQFMPSLLRDVYKLTPEEVKRMSATDQLDMVKRYLMPYKNSIDKYIDLYLAVFFPAAIGKPNTYTLETKNISRATIARANPGYAKGKNFITVGDIETSIFQNIPMDYRHFFMGSKKKVALIPPLL